MPTNFCPNCGAARGSGAFCSNCGQAYDVAPGPAFAPSQQQQLARAAVTAQTVNLVSWLGGVAGFILFGVLAWTLAPIEWRLIATIIAPFVGLFVGSRFALLLLAG